MKICPKCGRKFESELNFCLEDGTVLESDSEQTLSFGINQSLNSGKRPTNPQNYGQTDKNQSFGDLPTEVYRPKKSPLGTIIASVIIGVSILAGVSIYSLLTFFPRSTMSVPDEIAKTSPSPLVKKQLPRVSATTDKFKIEIGERLKAGFDETFLRCLLTNTGDVVIKEPRVSLMLYKNDLKVGEVSEESKLDYVKPGQTVPVWIRISERDNFTAARVSEDLKFNTTEKDLNLLYPSLVFTETKMTSEKLTSLFNFRPFKETFYEVKGTVENREYELVKPKIYVIFYDAKSEIVGITSTTPPDLKKNEKAEFEASMGDKSLFGVPVRFELIAIDDTRENN